MDGKAHNLDSLKWRDLIAQGGGLSLLGLSTTRRELYSSSNKHSFDHIQRRSEKGGTLWTLDLKPCPATQMPKSKSSNPVDAFREF